MVVGQMCAAGVIREVFMSKTNNSSGFAPESRTTQSDRDSAGSQRDSTGFAPDPFSNTPRSPGPPASAVAEMAARMAASAESSYTESVIDGLTAAILDERLDSLERAEAVVALKSYLQADWDSIATHVGVSGRSLQVIAGIIKLRESFKDSLRNRRIGLRHGAALVRLGELDLAAERLHNYLLLHQDVGGEEALRIAGLMVRQREMDPERARRHLNDDARRRMLLRGMSDSDAGPSIAIGFGIRAAVASLTAVDPTALSTEERKTLSADLASAMATIERLQQELDSIGH
jgi:hypothetical protein